MMELNKLTALKLLKNRNIHLPDFIIVGFLLIHTWAYSTNYYVAIDGKSTNTGISISSPFKDLTQALNLAIPGDTIFIRSGTYSYTGRITISKSGTVAKRICIMAYKPDLNLAYPDDGRPVFDFSGMAVSSGNQGFLLSDVQYLHIKGIRIKGAGDNGMIVRTSGNNIIEFCDFFKNRDSGLQLVAGSSNNLILNCDAFMNADIGPGTTTNGGNADGFAPKMDVGSGNVFRGCRAWLNSDDGWDGYIRIAGSIYPDGMSTTLENCWTWGNGYSWIDGTTTSEMNGNGFKMGGSDNKDLAHNFILKRCLSFYNKSKGFDQNSNAGSITLYNCTSHNNGGSEFMLNSSNVIYATGSIFTVKNSVALSPKSSMFRTGTTLECNNFSTSESDYVSIDTTGVSGQRKIDGSLPDINFMHLQTNPETNLIDAGTQIDGILYNGINPDLGCFETGEVLSSGKNETFKTRMYLLPNPARSFFQFSCFTGNENIRIYSLYGKILREGKIDLSNQKFDISDLENGIYIVQTQHYVFKLIKI